MYALQQRVSIMVLTERVSFGEKREDFDGRVISRFLWSVHLMNYLWGILKDKLYKTNPHTLEELIKNIRH